MENATVPHSRTLNATPTDDGVKLATLSRSPLVELRVRLKEFKTHAYIDLRVWGRRSPTDTWWPLKGKGVSVRLGELPAVIEALEQATRTPAADV